MISFRIKCLTFLDRFSNNGKQINHRERRGYTIMLTQSTQATLDLEQTMGIAHPVKEGLMVTTILSCGMAMLISFIIVICYLTNIPVSW
jgi:hypothetical protein